MAKGERTRLDSRLGPLQAARQRLGLASSVGGRSASQPLQRSSSGAGAGAGAGSSGSAAVPAGVTPVVRSVQAVAWDAVAQRLLYLVSYNPPYDNAVYDAWTPASSFGLSDAQLQAELRRGQRGNPPVVFDRRPFTGPADLDRGKPIPASVVLEEVEREEEDDDEVDGAGLNAAVPDLEGEEEEAGLVEEDEDEDERPYGRAGRSTAARPVTRGKQGQAQDDVARIAQAAAAAAAQAVATAVQRRNAGAQAISAAKQAIAQSSAGAGAGAGYGKGGAGLGSSSRQGTGAGSGRR